MTDWLNPAATLVASFAGAWSAFKLHAFDKAKDIRRENIAAVNRILLTMMQQANTLKLYQLDQIDPHRDNPGRHFAIRATLPYDLESFKFDFKSLDFFDTAEEQQLAFDLSVEERRYIEALKAINARSQLLLTEVDSKLSLAGFLDGGEYSGAQLKSAIGQPLYNKLERLTDDVIYHVDRTSESICEMQTSLLRIAKARFAKAKFITFEIPDAKAAP